MFNKETNKYVKKVKLTENEFYKQYNNISITPLFISMIDKYYREKNMQEHIDFDERTKSYKDKVFTFKMKKQYNPTISNLYNNGKISINKEGYYLKDFYIVFNNDNVFHLICTDNKYKNEEVIYDKSIKLIDTTAFIKLISNSIIENNTIIIDNIDVLLNIIKDWDGLLHNETSETEAIGSKNIIGNDDNG